MLKSLQKYNVFFVLEMRWLSNDSLNEMVGSDNKRFFFSTFRTEINFGDVSVMIIPAVKEFSSFTDAGVTINEAGMAEAIGGEKSLGVTFFDPYGFFWRKFTTFPPFSYENEADPTYANLEQIGLRCNVYLCKTTGDPSSLTSDNTEFYFLYQGQLADQPVYDFEEKTLSITIGSRSFNTERGYIPKIDHISSDTPAYNFLSAFLNEQLWPDVYGMAQHYQAVPLLKNPYFKVKVNKVIDHSASSIRLYIETSNGADDVFLDQNDYWNQWLFSKEFIFLFSGSGSEQYGGSFAYKAVGKLGIDYYTDYRGRLSRYLFCDINPRTITHYWYINIPVTRINDSAQYIGLTDPPRHVSERVKVKLGYNSYYGKHVEGGQLFEAPWLQHMWVRVRMTDDSIGDTREVTVKVIKQEGDICTLDWESDSTPAEIVWAGRAAGPPLVIDTKVKIVPYSGVYGDDILVDAFWNLMNTYVIDTKVLEHGVDIGVLDVSIPNGQNGYTSLPVSAFQRADGSFYNDVRMGNIPNYIGSCGHSPGSWFWNGEPFLNRPHEYCKFIRLRSKDGILRFLCEEEFQRVPNSDFTYQLYVTAETFVRTDYCLSQDLIDLIISCIEKKQVWGYDYTPVATGGVPEKKERWDLGDFYPTQMSDVEAMGILAFACGLKYLPNNSSVDHFECYPVNFILKERKTGIELINEISWQKGKVIRQRSTQVVTFTEPDFVIETVDLMNLVSMDCKELKNWRGGVERPAGLRGVLGNEDPFTVGTSGSRFNYINENNGKDPLTPLYTFDENQILDDGIQFSVSPEANLTTQMLTKVFLNRADDMVEVDRTISTIKYFGLRTLSAPINYYAYAGRDTVYFLDFWLRKLGKPRLRVTFNSILDAMSLSVNLFDVVKIEPGTTLFLNETFGMPPMYRVDLTDPESFVFEGSDLPQVEIQALSTFPICGRIINKKVNPNQALVEFTIEVENILGFGTPTDYDEAISSGNAQGLQSPAGAAFDIDGGTFITSPYLQRGLPGPYDLIEGSVKIEDLVAEAEPQRWSN